MGALVIRNLSEEVHDGLRRLAAEKKKSVEALARDALGDLVRGKRGGIDFEKLKRNRAALGLHEDGPPWTPAMDDPALSWKVLGMKPPKTATNRKKK